ncbi:MAG: hypothetical protein AABY78_06700 [Nitrospirota bacterium]
MAFYKGLQRIATIIRVFTIFIAGFIVVGGVFNMSHEHGIIVSLILLLLVAGVILAAGLIAAWIIEGFARRE